MMERVKKAKSALLRNPFMRHNAVFFIGTMVISVFNYLYYPVLSRIVSVSEFGEIQAVISLFMQLGIILTAYGYVITNIVTNSNEELDKKATVSLLRLEQSMFLLSFLLIPVLFLGAHFFGEQFQFRSLTTILLVGVLILINVPSTTRTYILQGERRLKEVSIGGSIFAIGKLIITVGLVYLLTNSVEAAVMSYIIAQVLSLLYLRLRTKRYHMHVRDMLRLRTFFRDPETKELASRYGLYGLFIVGVLSGLTLLYSSDTIIARLFFDEYQVGLYSGVASVARIIFFVTASVAGVLIASVRIKDSQVENRKTLLRSLILVGAAGVVGVSLFSIFREFFVAVFVGSGYAASAHWLPPLSITMLLCSIANLLAIYQIALRQYKALLPVFFGVAVLVVGLLTAVESVESFITTLLVANLTVVVLLLFQIFMRRG